MSEAINFKYNNVLLFSDRLKGESEILADFLKSNSNLHIVGIYDDFESAKEKVELEKLDFIVIVGYLSKEKNYEIVDYTRRCNHDIRTIHYALLDTILSLHDTKYRIYFRYDRTLPQIEMLEYMKYIEGKTDWDIV